MVVHVKIKSEWLGWWKIIESPCFRVYLSQKKYFVLKKTELALKFLKTKIE